MSYLKYVHNLSLILGIPAFMMAWGIDGTPFADYFLPSQVVYIFSLLGMSKYALIEGKHDAKKYPQKIDKATSSVFRVLAVTGLFFAFNFKEVFGVYNGIYICLSLLLSFSFVFAIKYNLTRKLNIWYVGSTAYYDRFFGQGKWIIEGLSFIVTILLVL